MRSFSENLKSAQNQNFEIFSVKNIRQIEVRSTQLECKQTFTSFFAFHNIQQRFFANFLSKTCWDTWQQSIVDKSSKNNLDVGKRNLSDDRVVWHGGDEDISCYHTGWRGLAALFPHMASTIRCAQFFGASTSCLLRENEINES